MPAPNEPSYGMAFGCKETHFKRAEEQESLMEALEVHDRYTGINVEKEAFDIHGEVF